MQNDTQCSHHTNHCIHPYLLYLVHSLGSSSDGMFNKKHNNNFQFNSNIIEIHQRRCCCCCYRFPRNHNKNIFYRNFSLRHTYVKPSLGTTKERKRERRVSVSLESKRTREWRVKNKKICGIVKLHLQID